MKTRSSQNWSSKPKCSLNSEVIFSSKNKYGIPDLEVNYFIPKDLITYNQAIRPSKMNLLACINGFYDDYKINPIWNRPNHSLTVYKKIGRAISLDFSLYMDYPIALQIYNVYRNRWLAKWWQEHDIQVIPSISWSDERSFDFCFLGVPKHNIVALSTVGLRYTDKRVFVRGFEEMLRQIEPKDLVLYGENEILDFDKYFENVFRYESFMKKRRRKINEK